ncbi:MAG: glycosyl hydrolase [Phocaeicola sp.]
MKINRQSIFVLLAAWFSLAACSTEVKHEIAQIDAPLFVTSSPLNGSSNVRAGRTTISVVYDTHIFFASKNSDQITLTGGEIVSANVIGSSNTLTIEAMLYRNQSYTLAIPAGLVTGPNAMEAPAVQLEFSTVSIDRNLVNPSASQEAKALYAYLLENYESNTLSGMMASVAWNNDESERIYQLTGKYPAINGYDYLHLPFSPSNWIDYSDITPVTDWADANGIVTISWHWNVPTVAPNDGNPEMENGNVEYAFYRDQTTYDADNALVEGTWENKVFVDDLATISAHLKLLSDARIPVLWRPFHEAAGGWFWWGKSAASCKAMWIYMFNYFQQQGLNNLIWVWTVETNDDEWYPGDAYVDIVGRDLYTQDANACASQFSLVANSYANKMVALSECGTVAEISTQWSANAKWLWFMPWYDNAGAENAHASDAWWIDAMNQSYVISRDHVPSFR